MKLNSMPNFNIKGGIIPPMITPMLDDDTLDLEGLARLINHVIDGGVHGVFILGTTGESTNLSNKLKHELTQKTCEIVAGRVPVLVGITDTSTVESVKLAQTASDTGAAACVAAPPYYYALSQPELIEYYTDLNQRLPLPLFLYNMPVHTKTVIEPKTVAELSKLEGIIGIKDSSANAVYFNKLIHTMKDKSEFTLWVGPEEIMAEAVMMGAAGGVNGGANIFPKLYVSLYEAAQSGDLEKVRELHNQVMLISDSLYTIGKYGSSYLKGVKAALSVLGICNDFMASPLHRFEKSERDQVVKAVENIKSVLA
ncbi:dihydrodipicolinate synthase family protein [Belliella sp. DSM 111904]|uniref:Dihydrodipicolinate synthase family protein n=1 Tax=Belliella filtrata TaxID=2923435 RepID=A0ABS9UV95_9BACT|nr:dihydrodipicolinate synthase family protein [Belliella filtrata]MCH7408097.1 dihydrodipicolinate synthase family protein [Belliella filtrata]